MAMLMMLVYAAIDAFATFIFDAIRCCRHLMPMLAIFRFLLLADTIAVAADILAVSLFSLRQLYYFCRCHAFRLFFFFFFTIDFLMSLLFCRLITTRLLMPVCFAFFFFFFYADVFAACHAVAATSIISDITPLILPPCFATISLFFRRRFYIHTAIAPLFRRHAIFHMPVAACC